MTDHSSFDFLRRLKLPSPIKITKIRTDTGPQFTDRFAMKDKKPSGQHAFDKVCADMEIEHRLAPPRHPQTNGMVERLNGCTSELLKQTRFDGRADLETLLLNYLKLYNHHIPQRHRYPNANPSAQRMAATQAGAIRQTRLRSNGTRQLMSRKATHSTCLRISSCSHRRTAIPRFAP